MAPPTAMPPEAMGMPPEAMGMPPEAMGMPAGISPEDEALLGGVAQLGEDYVQDMMGGLDTADTPEGLINALRGNDLPLEARYDELAQLVGPEDAQATPESVLALVQPTLMLVDAGVGSLMPGVAGETEMMTESGAPTPMGEGVGNLMMAGAPPPDMMMAGAPPPDMMMAGAPPPDMMMANQVSPQGFWRGGPVVQRFQDGNEVSSVFGDILSTEPKRGDLAGYYQTALDPIESILGRTGKEKQYAKSQFWADVANRAFSFGAGVNPETGESVAHLSPAAQFAVSAKTLPSSLIKSAAEDAEQQREIKKFALATGMSERESDYKQSQALQIAALEEEAAIEAAKRKRKFELADKPANLMEMYIDGEHVATLDKLEHKDLIHNAGKIPRSGIRFHTPSSARDAVDAATLKASGMVDLYDNRGNHVDTLNLSSTDALKKIEAHRVAGGTISKIGTTPAPSGQTILNNPALMTSYGEGASLDERGMSRFVSEIEDTLKGQVSPSGVIVQGAVSGAHLLEMAKRIRVMEESLPELTGEADTMGLTPHERRRAQLLGISGVAYKVVRDDLEGYLASLPLPGEARLYEEGGPVVQKFQDGNEVEKLFPPREIEYAAQATGPWRGVQDVLYDISAATKGLFQMDDRGFLAEPLYMNTMKASKDMNTLAQMTKRFLQSSVAGREGVQQLQQMEEYDLLRPSMWTSDEAGLEMLKNMRGILDAHSVSQNLVTSSDRQPVMGDAHAWLQKTRDEAALKKPILDDLIGAYDRAIKGYEMEVGVDIPIVTTDEEYRNIPSGGLFKQRDPNTNSLKTFVKPQ